MKEENGPWENSLKYKLICHRFVHIDKEVLEQFLLAIDHGEDLEFFVSNKLKNILIYQDRDSGFIQIKPIASQVMLQFTRNKHDLVCTDHGDKIPVVVVLGNPISEWAMKFYLKYSH